VKREPLEERKEEVDEQLTPDTQIPSEPTVAAPAVPEVPAAPPGLGETVTPPEPATTVVAPEVPEAPAAEKKTKMRGRWTLIAGAIIIIGGLVYLLYELGWFSNEKGVSHWWGFLILIPAVVCFVVAGLMWSKKTRRLAWGVVRLILIGLALVALALVFALKSDLNEVWPVLAIIVGVGVALSWKG